MYEEKGADGRRKYTVAEIAETFGVSRKTVYRHLEPSGGRRQPGKTTPPLRDARHEHLAPPVVNTAAAAPSRPPATGS
jgi:DNA invertase Pin-like site-specific DNA recombinase